ncbi:MICOS complex subunit MIC27 isoform X2 [Atheta coriaria]|uniref:MICOS complex subunit MIC27 isoform X2 n=1 Tax=Dalotia coriaria TaxID=877792 RepID=UPI0031F444B6
MSARAISRILFSAAVIAPETDLKCCKRTELPLYTQDKLPTECAPKTKHHVEKSGVIEETIRTIRLNIDSVFNEVKKYEDMTRGHLQEGVDNAQWLVDYLGDEENQAPKAPAIAIGGLTGFIFGLRGGFFKKVIYTSVGALGMAAVCYPKEAREYGGLALDEGHRYATIAYNFAYGVKKGDKPLELPTLPKLPGSVSEVMSVVSEFVSSTSASLTDKSQKLSAEASDPKKAKTDK